jgi:hypothetical protein
MMQWPMRSPTIYAVRRLDLWWLNSEHSYRASGSFWLMFSAS